MNTEPEEEKGEEFDLASLEYTHVHTTCESNGHDWVSAGFDSVNNMHSEVCSKCWIGRSILKV